MRPVSALRDARRGPSTVGAVRAEDEIAVEPEKPAEAYDEAPVRMGAGDRQKIPSGHEVEIFLLGEELQTDRPVNRPIDGSRQPVQQRDLGVEFDRKPAIGRGETD